MENESPRQGQAWKIEDDKKEERALDVVDKASPGKLAGTCRLVLWFGILV